MDKAIDINNIGKMYKLFNNPKDKLLDVFGLNKIMFWKEQSYTEFWALRSIDLNIDKGERLGIIGKNGAGKSTLLKLISGNISPTEGKIKVNGKIQALMQLGTGFHPEFTGRENIRASLSYNGVSSKKIKQLEEEIIDFSELEDFIEQPVKVYSSGMYSRLAFAVSTVLEPDILIIDEVLGAGDASFITKCSQRMKRLTQETGATVLFVSHSMDSVLEICNKAILLERGQITYQGPALEASKIYNKKIREEDELYLKAKEYKLRKKDIKSLNNNQDYNILLLRFRVNQEHPAKRHKIYKIRIASRDKELASITVGGPMDNDYNSVNRIIDGVGSMDWGICKKDGRGFFRYYENENGVNCHAPFQLAIPKYVEKQILNLAIYAEIQPDEDILLERWTENGYELIGKLTGEKQCFEFLLKDIYDSKLDNKNIEDNDEINALKDDDIEFDRETDDFILKDPIMSIDENIQDEDEELLNKDEFNFEKFLKSNSIYGSLELIINNIDILDSKNQSRRVFFIGEKMVFRFEIESKTETISKFVLCASILTSTGKPVGQVICDSEELGLNNFKGRKTIKLQFNPCRFGQDEYMVSFGVFKEYDLNTEKENEAYCVVDRAVFFKVLQPENMKKGIGAFAHSCTWIQGENYVHYDAAKHL